MESLNSDGIELIPWGWVIPASLVQFTLEDIINSNNHHYDVYVPENHMVQTTQEDRRELRPDLSRRLRKVSKLLEEKKVSLELQNERRNEGGLFGLLRNSDV